ncbi:MAG: type VII secretion integral membrane protein EccD [Pseudonocardia sediminis]
MTEEQLQHRTTTSGRLRFVLGDKATDIALPAEVPLADLLPAVLPQFGAEWIEQGADHEGWVAQRLGEAPLDEDRTLAELGLLDGETILLRPRADQLAPIDFDDIVAGVGEQVGRHPRAWTPARSRVMLRAGSVAALLLGVPLLLAGGPAVVQAVVAAVVSLGLLAASALVARGAGDPLVGTILAGVSACYAAVAGGTLVLALDPVASPMTVLACAAAGALEALTVGLILVADGALLFIGAITFSIALAVAGLIGAVSPASVSQAAACALMVTLILGTFVPSIAFRLSGLSLPLLPTGASELNEDIEPVPHQLVVDRGTAVVGYSDALHIGMGAAQAILLAVVVAAGDGWAMIYTAVVALLLFLRSRHPDGLLQRWSVLVPAGLAVAANLLVLGAAQDTLGRLLGVWLPVIAVGALLLLGSDRLPGRRLRPYWGRAVDIFESLTAVATLPLLLQVLGVYATMRGLAG